MLFVQKGDIVDYGATDQITCSGLGRVEFLGGGLGSFVFYRNTIVGGRECMREYSERQVCGRVYAPLETIPDAVDLMLAALVESGLARAASLARRLISG